MKRIVSICAIAALTCVSWAGAALGGEPRGMQTYSFPVEFPFYLSCLGDTVTVKGIIYVRTHEFETNSGVVHFLDTRSADYFAGDTSGREWYYVGVADIVTNARVEKGSVFHLNDVGKFVPLTEDTPTLMLRYKTQMTVNANGELVVDGDDFNVDAAIRCIRQ